MPFGVDETRAAVIAIDLHRGHLDPGVATMPVPSGVEQQVIEANRRFFDQCREVEIPIVHLVTKYRDVDEIRTNRFGAPEPTTRTRRAKTWSDTTSKVLRGAKSSRFCGIRSETGWLIPKSATTALSPPT